MKINEQGLEGIKNIFLIKCKEEIKIDNSKSRSYDDRIWGDFYHDIVVSCKRFLASNEHLENERQNQDEAEKLAEKTFEEAKESLRSQGFERAAQIMQEWTENEQ